MQAQTTSKAEIEQKDKSEWWKLKGICCKISLKLQQRLGNDFRVLSTKRTTMMSKTKGMISSATCNLEQNMQNIIKKLS